MSSVVWRDDSMRVRLFQMGLRVTKLFFRHADKFSAPSGVNVRLVDAFGSLMKIWESIEALGDQSLEHYRRFVCDQLHAMSHLPGRGQLFRAIREELATDDFFIDDYVLGLNRRAFEAMQNPLCQHD